MRVRMLNPDKLGRIYDVSDEKAADLIARGVAEAVKDKPVKTQSVTVEHR